MNSNLKTRQTKNASVSPTSNGFRLTIPASSQSGYRLAQLDDYKNLARSNFLSHPPLTLSLRARASSQAIPGTWGFGLWNDPFGLSLGFGGNPFQLPALPNAVWFFHASEQNYLSFQSEKPAQGFIAQSFRAPKFHRLLIPAGLAFPFSRKTTRKYLGRVIDEDSAAVSVDVTQWHDYRLEWSPNRSAFWVDEALVLESPVSPRPPLGLVIWIDNQFAAFRPDGKISFGVLAGREERLEIEGLEIKRSLV
ncbi:MAG: hypothetical protein HYX49_04410 [Chloroflexi bacterium]|nr:hypothetical protein [Chloroflexota bacterium]